MTLTDVGTAALPSLPGRDGPGSRRARRAERHRRWRAGLGAVVTAPLTGVLVVQAALTAALGNTAFQDEALYLYAGHQELGHLFHGTPLYEDFATYFSGDPWLYPLLGAAVDSVAGLAGARALSLLALLATTALMSDLTRRLAGPQAALGAALTVATSGSVLFMGGLATYDAPAVLLLALSAWVLVRTVGGSPLRVALVAPLLVLAVFTKYACLLYLPTLLAYAGAAGASSRARAVGSGASLSTGALTGGPLPGRRPVRRELVAGALRAAGLLGAGAAVAAGVIAIAGTDFLAGLTATTTARAAGGDPPGTVLGASVGYLVLPLLGAVVGAVVWARDGAAGTRGGLVDVPVVWRVLLGVALVVTLLLAPVNQARMHTMVSLHKHLGYGVALAAPLVGIALGALLGEGRRDARRFGAVLLVVVGAFGWGQSQAQARYHDWPRADALVDLMRTQVRPTTGRYLVEENEVPRYYLGDLVKPYQWASTFYFEYTTAAGKRLTGVEAYRAALAEKYFDLVVLRYGPTAELDRAIDAPLREGRGYEQVATLGADSTYGQGTFTVWRAVR